MMPGFEFDRYDQEAAYRLVLIERAMEHISSQLTDLLKKVGELVALEGEGAWRNEKMLEMQTEMFEDYKKAKDRAHVKLQGDMEGDHASTHTA